AIRNERFVPERTARRRDMRYRLAPDRSRTLRLLSLNTIALATALAVLLVSFWNRNDIPGNIVFDAAIRHEPRQSPTSRQPFSIEWHGVQYRVEPVYDYELTGMIVSYWHHDAEKSRMHRRANDHL